MAGEPAWDQTVPNWDTYVAWTVCGATGSETKIFPYCMNWYFGAHSFWRDTLLSLDIAGRALVLPQSDVLGYVDSPLGKPYPV